MYKNELNELRAYDGSPCITIVAQTYTAPPQAGQNPTILNKAAGKVEELLKENDWEQAEEAMSQLKIAINGIDKSQSGKTTIIYAAPGYSKVISLPYEVKERVTVSDRFQVRELVYAANQMIDYLVLSINKDQGNLYRGTGQSLEVVDDDKFPRNFKDLYQHPQPSPPYNHDKSSIVQTREKQYFQKIDELFAEYVKNSKIPVILVGVEADRAAFKEVSHYTENIVAEIDGSTANQSLHELSQDAWNALMEYRQNQKAKILYELDDVKDKVFYGIEEVITNINVASKGMLIVERDFSMPAKLYSELFTLSLNGGLEEKSLDINDAVDLLIETIYSRNGEVIFVDNDKLNGYNHIVLKPENIRLS